MCANVSHPARLSYDDQHKRRHLSSTSQSSDERLLTVNERKYTIKLHHRRAQVALSFYDNSEVDESDSTTSKWAIVRQRLPDILALSETYKPSTIRAQLVLLVALMNKQAGDLIDESFQLVANDHNNTISHIIPSSVILDISGRSRMICLKRIPSEQMIHVDIDGLSFSIPTRQFIIAISRGHAHETAAKFCPPAISDMLIDLSKTKIIYDRRQYERAQFKMRVGQSLFFFTFIFIIIMMFTLIISATKTIFAPDSHNKTLRFIPMDFLLFRYSSEFFQKNKTRN